MKTSNTTRFSFSILFVFTLYLFFACKGNGEQSQDISQMPDTTFVERIDTIVVFDPETQIETVEIRKSIDTIINNYGEQKQAVSHKPDTSFVPVFDTVVLIDPKTYKQTVKITKSIDTIINK